MIRFLTAGESHGPGLVTIVEGLPRGLAVSAEGVSAELARRRLGFGRGKRMALEKDELEILGGVRHGYTLGSPVAMLIRNTEWRRWSEEMGPGPGEAKKVVTRPRPGHADLPGNVEIRHRRRSRHPRKGVGPRNRGENCGRISGQAVTGRGGGNCHKPRCFYRKSPLRRPGSPVRTTCRLSTRARLAVGTPRPPLK